MAELKGKVKDFDVGAWWGEHKDVNTPLKMQAEQEDVEMEDEDPDETKAKSEAEAEKKLGAAAYKSRDLENAIVHFQKAWDIWPKDITFLSNLGGKCPSPYLVLPLVRC